MGVQSGSRAVLGFVLCLVCLAGCGETAEQRSARDTVDRFYAALKAHARRRRAASCRHRSRRRSCASPGWSGNRAFPGSRSSRPRWEQRASELLRLTPRSQRSRSAVTRRKQYISAGTTAATALRRMEGRWQITGSPDIH